MDLNLNYLEVYMNFSRALMCVTFVLFACNSLVGMQMPIARNEEQQRYYMHYTDVATDIIQDYYRSTNRNIDPGLLGKTAEMFGYFYPSYVLRKADARSLSLLGCSDDNLLSAINRRADNSNRTQSLSGTLQLGAMLVNPQSAQALVTTRQSCLKELATNTEKREAIRAIIQKGFNNKHHEYVLYDLLMQPRRELPEEQRRHYFQNLLLQRLNTNPKVLNAAIIGTKLWYILWFYANAYGVFPCMGALDRILKDPAAAKEIFKATMHEIKENGKNLSGSLYRLVNIYAMLRMYQQFKVEKGTLTACTNVVGDYCNAASLVGNAFIGPVTYEQQYGPGQQQIENYISTISTLCDVIEQVFAITEAGTPFWPSDCTRIHTSESYKNLRAKLKQISSNTYADRLARPGRVLALYKEITDSKQRFISDLITLLKVIGTIDAYCALAEYISEHLNDQHKPISFVNFTRSLGIDLKNSWAGVFNGTRPTLNTIQLGKDAPRNMLLVAPNSSGKSSVMRTAMINAVTAQVAGFVTAQEGSEMPFFNLLGCYMNVKEDPSSGLSTGAAQVNGLEELKKLILQPRFSSNSMFVIIDEPLSGTPEWLAQKLICTDMPNGSPSLCLALERNPNVLSVIATHFKTVQVEDKKSFGAYHMKIDPADENRQIFIPRYALAHGDHPWWFNESSDAEQMRKNFSNWYLAKITGQR